MGYEIYFDESNKLDQPQGDYSYYGALGITSSTKQRVLKMIKEKTGDVLLKNELHFVDYKSDAHFGRYFNVLNAVLDEDICMNIMIVHKKSARNIANHMEISMNGLRELMYVKIPERLFYGLTRNLDKGQRVSIFIDENSEYEKIGLESKLKEQMNAHSAYRNIGYKVERVKQVPSNKNIPLQLIDVYMGMVVYILEQKYVFDHASTITQQVKADLIYRLFIEKDNMKKFHNKITLFKWDGNNQVRRVNLSEYTGAFIVEKAQFDVQEMNRLSCVVRENPEENMRYYRKEMDYSQRQLRTIHGYMDELQGKGRNSYYES